jgi:RNA polymerase sigma factor (sigma-70 family)
VSAVIESAVVGAQPLGYCSDEALISRLRANDDNAFATLVSRYEHQLLAFCRRMLGSREDAEDVLQDTFAAAYKAILADDRVIEARPWLYQIARNRCLNTIRGRHHTQPLAVEGVEREAPLSTVDQVARRVELNLLVGDILALPAQQRQALVLHELEGCSYAEIAHHLGASVASVRSLLLRARRSLLALAEGRALSCAETRLQLQEADSPSAALRRHIESCADCAQYQRSLKRRPLRVLRALSPLGALAGLKNLLLGRVLREAGPTGAAGAAGAGGAASLGAGGALTAGAGVSGAVVKALAGLALLAAAGTGTVVTQQATTGGHHHASPPAPASAPVALPPHSVQSVASPPSYPAAGPSTHSGVSEPAHASTPAARPTSTTPQSTPPTTPSSSGTQGGSGVQTPSSPTTAARSRPLSGSGMAPARTRPLPVEAPYSQGTTGSSSTSAPSGQGSSTTTTQTSPTSTDTSRYATEQQRRHHREWRHQSQF